MFAFPYLPPGPIDQGEVVVQRGWKNGLQVFREMFGRHGRDESSEYGMTS